LEWLGMNFRRIGIQIGYGCLFNIFVHAFLETTCTLQQV